MKCKVTVSAFFSLLGFAVFLNITGLCLLVDDRTKRTNQNLILKFLSSLELAYSCVLIIKWSFRCHGSNITNTVVEILHRISYCSYLNITLIMVIMTLDRLIATKYPFRYAFILTRKKTAMILSASTSFWIIVGASSSGLKYDQFIRIFRLLDLIVAFVSALFMIATYVFIFIKTSRRPNLGNSLRNIKKRSRIENKRFLRMAAIITATYFICFLLPDVATLFCHECFANSTFVYRILWNLGPVCDPITYIFMQKRLRKRLTRLICCRKKTQKGGSRIEMGASIISEHRREIFDTRL